MKKFALILAVLAVAGVAGAAPTVTFTHFTQTIAGVNYVVNDMLVTTTSDYNNARLNFSLTAGTVYQHAFGSDTTPNPSLVVAFPDLAFDTYVTNPSGTVTVAGGSFAALPISWGSTSQTDIGSNMLIARITLTADAQGLILDAGATGTRVYDKATEGVGVAVSGWEIVNGAIVPEPATLSLLGLGLLGLIRRRR